MGEAIVFTSGKGGVGKTTTIANIGAGLSQLDKKVVMLDADMGLRNLDICLGMEDRITYNLLDLLENYCRLNQALIKDKHFPNLFMIPASLKCRKLKDYEERLLTLVAQLKNEFDYCLIDCPAGIDDGFHFAVSAADHAIVVTTPQISAVRDAGRVIYLLEQNQIPKIHLLINEVNQKMIKNHDMLSCEDVKEILEVPCIGEIPLDEKIIISQNQGIPTVFTRSRLSKCYLDVCRKINELALVPADLSEEREPKEKGFKIVKHEKKAVSFFRRKECEYEA